MSTVNIKIKKTRKPLISFLHFLCFVDIDSQEVITKMEYFYKVTDV